MQITDEDEFLFTNCAHFVQEANISLQQFSVFTAVMSSEHVIKMKLKGKQEEQKATLPKAIPRKESGS
jgi:hypothetical protein